VAWHVFLSIGLLTGFAEQHFANARMGLAADKAIAYWAALYGTYANWLVTTLAAAFGTAALSPITGADHSGQPWQDGLVTVGFLTRRHPDSRFLDTYTFGACDPKKCTEFAFSRTQGLVGDKQIYCAIATPFSHNP
jgi:hypothetical protein